MEWPVHLLLVGGGGVSQKVREFGLVSFNEIVALYENLMLGF